MQRGALRRSTPLRRISPRRLEERRLYLERRVRFLAEHPYCAVWLDEHGVAEAVAIAGDGWVTFNQVRMSIPRSTTVHHRDKRRGARLLDESGWMAVSFAAHCRIETNKAWGRTRGYLSNF